MYSITLHTAHPGIVKRRKNPVCIAGESYKKFRSI